MTVWCEKLKTIVIIILIIILGISYTTIPRFWPNYRSSWCSLILSLISRSAGISLSVNDLERFATARARLLTGEHLRELSVTELEALRRVPRDLVKITPALIVAILPASVLFLPFLWVVEIQKHSSMIMRFWNFRWTHVSDRTQAHLYKFQYLVSLSEQSKWNVYINVFTHFLSSNGRPEFSANCEKKVLKRRIEKYVTLQTRVKTNARTDIFQCTYMCCCVYDKKFYRVRHSLVL